MLIVYLKDEETLFSYYKEEITRHSYKNILDTIKEIKKKYNIKKEKVSLIFDFSKFYISFFEASHHNANEEKESIKNLLSNEIDDYDEKDFITKQFYLDHPQRKSILFSIKKDIINNIKSLFKKNGLIIYECKIDLIAVYKFYENQNITILNLGDNLSSFISIKDKNITEFKNLNININDIDNLTSYEFILEEENLVILDYSPENIYHIFEGSLLLTDMNFLISQHSLLTLLKKLNLKSCIFYIIIIFTYILINNSLSFDSVEKQNKYLKEEINILQEKLLDENNKIYPDYEKEINQLNSIIESMKYQNHYKFLNYLIRISNIDIGFSKIIYENNSWIIEGDASKFKDIENFEFSLFKYSKKLELIFIKSSVSGLTFQYKTGDIFGIK